jgi:PilZ domain-containing protein
VLKNVFSAFQSLMPGSNPPVEERREIVRIPCKVPVIVLPESGGEMTAVVIDMGLKGLRLETDKKLSKKKAVRVIRPNGGPIVCQVKWTRPKRFSEKFHTGVEFSDSAENMRASWIKDTLRQLGFQPGRIKEKRKHIRVPSESRAVLASVAGDELGDGVLVNMGVGGALVAIDVAVPEGNKTILRVDPVGALPLLEMPAVIRSVHQNKRTQKHLHGLRFDDQDNRLVKRYLSILMKSV